MRAVIFDLGGVVLPSPLDAFAEYESTHGLPGGFISGVVIGTGDAGAWSRHERGELSFEQFCDEFDAEARSAGGEVDVAELLDAITRGSEPRPTYLRAIDRIRAAGLGTAALTNNWAGPDRAASSDPTADALNALADRFDVVVESAVVGLRKPDPAIYELVCSRLDVSPGEAVFLDDLGPNLKPARALGMHTIKVSDPAAALAELADVLALDLD
ncbi:MAG: HAD family phosphatase [Acidimicrobiia bacterium]